MEQSHFKMMKVNGQRFKVFLEPFNSSEKIDVIHLIDFNSSHLFRNKKKRAQAQLIANTSVTLTHERKGSPMKQSRVRPTERYLGP
jgi:hypothetical protein